MRFNISILSVIDEENIVLYKIFNEKYLPREKTRKQYTSRAVSASDKWCVYTMVYIRILHLVVSRNAAQGPRETIPRNKPNVKFTIYSDWFLLTRVKLSQ